MSRFPRPRLGLTERGALILQKDKVAGRDSERAQGLSLGWFIQGAAGKSAWTAVASHSAASRAVVADRRFNFSTA